MKKYTFWLEETDGFRAWIDAESEAEAIEKINAYLEGNSEGPEIEKVGKVFKASFDPASLKEVN